MSNPNSPNQPTPSRPNPGNPGPQSSPQPTSKPEVELPTHRPQTDEPDASSLKQNEGEGSWSAARRYNQGVQESVQRQQGNQQDSSRQHGDDQGNRTSGRGPNQSGSQDNNRPGVKTRLVALSPRRAGSGPRPPSPGPAAG